jgi:hypothetical protein
MRRVAGVDRLLAVGAGGQSNDLGEFRLFGLPSGEYFIQAVPRLVRGPGPGAATPRSTMVAPTYYPGVVESAAAQSIFLSSGQTSDSIAITLQTVAAFRISGLVVDETGAPIDGAMIWVMPAGGVGMSMGPPANVRSDNAGRFTAPNLQAGTYQVSAAFPVVVTSPGGGSPPAGSGGVAVSSGFTTFGSGIVGGVTGGISATETRGATTIQFRTDDANRVDVEVSADVVGLRLVARRP